MLRMNQSHQLAEDRLPCVHATSLAEAKKHRETGHRTSNRSHLIRRATPVPADGWKISALQQLDRHENNSVNLMFAEYYRPAQDHEGQPWFHRPVGWKFHP
jgi:hypothetical protein